MIMIKIDLITGFLGSGKTTFILKYAKYLMEKGEKVCILENDYGAINVDMMLVSSIGCDCEMVAGGCDYDCHLRRFKTKLISMAMSGYTRIIVEPSGVYDTDEFFDVLYEEPLINYYEVGNVFVLYDINTKNLSEESEYIFVSEAAVASKLIITKRDNKSLILDTNYINGLMKKYMCDRVFMDRDIVYNDSLNIDDIINAGYASYDHIKLRVIEDNNYDSLYIMNKKLNKDFIIDLMNKLFNSKDYGNILRIKGFIYENDKWYKVNITRNDIEIDEIDNGQDVIIVIGENLDKNKINALVGE